MFEATEETERITVNREPGQSDYEAEIVVTELASTTYTLAQALQQAEMAADDVRSATARKGEADARVDEAKTALNK